MNPHHRTFLHLLWPDRDDREAPAAMFAPVGRRVWKDGYVTALGEAQGSLDTMTTWERLRLAWAILRGRS